MDIEPTITPDTVLTITPNGVKETPSHEKETVLGRKTFGDKIDITDPCYKRETWCRMNDVEIEPGEYECYITTMDNEATDGWGERVSEIGIRNTAYVKDPYTLVYEHIGQIGVDSGLAGFFNHKLDYTTEDWLALCEEICALKSQAWIREDGFFSGSGYGDGDYDVFAASEDGKVIALFIEFIDPDNE